MLKELVEKRNVRSRGQEQREKTNCRDNRRHQASGIAPLGALRYDFPVPIRIHNMHWKERERERERESSKGPNRNTA